MAERVEVDPDRVDGVADIAGDIRDRLSGIAGRARAAVSAGQAAWGDDEFGSKFADGDEGFVAGSRNMATGTDNLSSSFGNLVQGLTEAAQNLRLMEQRNTGRF
ncbi:MULTISPECIES: hypothetical protein [Nocardia]|uniref:WXG100 family type VII secretion target n=1 Tax=Nocardia otitidiscaviarum TaxID=1823 RepID=A0A516NS96_9NOCA|nr:MULTISPECIES: hypothetical protein [Nocardia]MBF6179624.1 hypothetical protein [Nocardia otitidiscaviarum]MBF6235783.1 hypothetical protein [Nocardia otitidiscaviarum]MCP9621014.1 hypothetical protein [Nocardia otitidiscaviarum]QDP81778.1 hypothetical protein FOH10_26665 [Nocardia otitidiscaviarum]